MAKLELHISPAANGGWELVRSDTDQPYGHFNTKQEAIAIGEQVAKEERAHLVIHSASGAVEEEIPPAPYPYEVPVHED